MNPKSVSQKEIEEKWFEVDVAGLRLGTAASRIAELLLGKTDPKVREYLDPKAHVVAVNVEKVDIPPKRQITKYYKNYSGYPSGLRFTNIEERLKEQPTFALENAVKGMLPKNTRGRKALTRLNAYLGEGHPHEAQKPKKVDITKITI